MYSFDDDQFAEFVDPDIAILEAVAKTERGLFDEPESSDEDAGTDRAAWSQD